MHFKDHFSNQASNYHLYRPQYPPELFAYLASLAARHDLVWDCATGNGQAAFGLAPYFRQVIATDASEKQIAQAMPHAKVTYQIAPAEKTNIAAGAVDLVAVAQALHWFDFEEFYAEVRRVLWPEGVLAIWTYNLATITPEIDAVIKRFYHEIVALFWPPERKHVEEAYRNIPFPFAEVRPPYFEMQAEWTLDHLLGYLSTWSSVQRYREHHRADPVELIKEDLLRTWGEGEIARKISWPLHVRIGKLR